MATFAEQLSTLPIERLTTVLRLDLRLYATAEQHQRARLLLRGWLRRKSEARGFSIGEDPVSQESRSFRLESESTKGISAFSLEERRLEGKDPRDWITEVSLSFNGEADAIGLRLSYRQPQNWTAPPPLPRAPGFLCHLVDEGLVHDIWPLASTVRRIEAAEIEAFIGLLRNPERTLPVLAVSENYDGRVLVDADKLASLSAGTAHVVHLTFEASRRMSAQLGKHWSTYQGAIRCYKTNVELADESSTRKHQLWLSEGVERLNAKRRDGFIDTCLRYVFIENNASFEAKTLVSPALLRRRREQDALPLPPPESFPETERVDAHAGTEREQVRLLELQRALDEQKAFTCRLEAELRSRQRAVVDLEGALAAERLARAEDARTFEGLVQSYEEDNKQIQRLITGDFTAETSEALRPLWQAFVPFFQSLQTVATHLRSREEDLLRYDRELEQAKEYAQGAEDDRDRLRSKLAFVEGRSASLQFNMRAEPLWVQANLTRLVEEPTLRLALEALENSFPDRIVILESARRSAAESPFRDGAKAFTLLWRLATDYWERLQEGGDVQAREVYGRQYAAKERDNLSEGGRRSRTFLYNGEEVFMRSTLS